MDSDKEIKAKYIFSDDYEPQYIMGVLGNIQPSGDLAAHFYFERTPIPYETSQAINEDGSIGREVKVTKPEDYFKLRRTIKSGIIMNPTTTLNVYMWLKEKLKEMGISEDEL